MEVFPFKDHLVKGVLSLILIFVFSWLVGYSLQSPLFGLITTILILIPSTNFFFPIQFHFFEDHLVRIQLMQNKKIPYDSIRNMKVSSKHLFFDYGRRKGQDLIAFANEDEYKTVYGILNSSGCILKD